MWKRDPEKVKQWNRHIAEVRNNLHAQGLCTNCGRDSGGKWLCIDCKENERATRKRLEYARLMAGLCVRCGKPNPDGPIKPRCAECRRQDSLRAIKRYWRLKAENAAQIG